MTMENKIVKVYVLKGLNGISLVIDSYRVSDKKIYGMLTPIHTFEVATDDILQAIGLKHNQSEDCVSRQAVLAIASDSCLDLNSYEETKEFCDEIKELPPVTPTRKVGHWIDYWGDKTEPDGETWWSGCKCSGCGTFTKAHYNYCPNCGAKMRGSKNGI